MIEIYVEGIPVEKPKNVVQIRTNGRKPYPVFFEKKSNKSIAWKESIRVQAKLAMDGKDMFESEPLRITSWIILPRPKTVTRFAPSVKPDIDNLFYLPHNCLEGIVYKNDSQIIHVNERKLYERGLNVEPGLIIQIEEVTELEVSQQYRDIELTLNKYTIRE